MAILVLSLAPCCWAQNYVLVRTSTPAAIGSVTNKVQGLPSLLKDPSTGKVFLFYQQSNSGILTAPSWIILKTSTATRLTANPQDWDLNTDTSHCSGSFPAGCFVGDSSGVFGSGFGVGVTPGGALEIAYLQLASDATTTIGSFYMRSTDHGTTWSNPVAFSVTYPASDYDSPSGQFISIPAGQATGPCSSGCVIKTLRTSGHSPGIEILTSFDDGVTFTTEVGWGAGHAISGYTDELAFVSPSGNNIMGFARPSRTGPAPNGPIPLSFMWASDLPMSTINSTCGRESVTIADCVSPNQPNALTSACPAGQGVPSVEEYTWPSVYVSPINSAYNTLTFGHRLTCFNSVGNLFFGHFYIRSLTFNAATAFSSQTFALTPQYLLDLSTTATGTQDFGNSTYSFSIPTTGNNVLTVYENPISTTCATSVPCEQIWSFNATMQPMTSTSGSGAKLSQGATIQ